MNQTLSALVQTITVMALPAIFAVTFHEAAHGFVAYRLGDDTAWRMGRVTFNPIKHIDLIGTIVFPLVLLLASGGRFIFGYAKPVPVRFDRLNHPRRDMVWVALAGPATNVLLALVSAVLFGAAALLPAYFRGWTETNLINSVEFNVILAVFNMIPLPPLDGGRVAVGLLPEFLAVPLARTERYGMMILLTLLFLLPMLGGYLHVDLNVIWWIIQRPAQWLLQAIAWLTGQ